MKKASRSVSALALVALGLLAGECKAATWVTVGPVGNYLVTMDNDRVYINHPSIVSPCANQRVEIQSALPFSADYAKRITALLFSANFAERQISFTFDSTTGTAANGYACLLNSLVVY